MKKTLTILFAGLTLAGCALFQGANTPAEKAFVAGKLSAAIYLDITAVDADVTQTARMAYAVLVRITDSDVLLDLNTVVNEEVFKLNGSAVAQVLVLEYYNVAIENLSDKLGGIDVTMDLLTEFRYGVESVLQVPGAEPVSLAYPNQ